MRVALTFSGLSLSSSLLLSRWYVHLNKIRLNSSLLSLRIVAKKIHIFNNQNVESKWEEGDLCVFQLSHHIQPLKCMSSISRVLSMFAYSSKLTKNFSWDKLGWIKKWKSWDSGNVSGKEGRERETQAKSNSDNELKTRRTVERPVNTYLGNSFVH